MENGERLLPGGQPLPPAFSVSAHSKGVKRGILRKCGFHKGYKPCVSSSYAKGLQVMKMKELREKQCGCKSFRMSRSARAAKVVIAKGLRKGVRVSAESKRLRGDGEAGRGYPAR